METILIRKSFPWGFPLVFDIHYIHHVVSSKETCWCGVSSPLYLKMLVNWKWIMPLLSAPSSSCSPTHHEYILEEKNTPTTWADSKYFTDYACKEEIIIYHFSKSAVLHAYRKTAGTLAIQTLGQEATFPCEAGTKVQQWLRPAVNN